MTGVGSSGSGSIMRLWLRFLPGKAKIGLKNSLLGSILWLLIDLRSSACRLLNSVELFDMAAGCPQMID